MTRWPESGRAATRVSPLQCMHTGKISTERTVPDGSPSIAVSGLTMEQEQHGHGGILQVYDCVTIRQLNSSKRAASSSVHPKVPTRLGVCSKFQRMNSVGARTHPENGLATGVLDSSEAPTRVLARRDDSRVIDQLLNEVSGTNSIPSLEGLSSKFQLPRDHRRKRIAAACDESSTIERRDPSSRCRLGAAFSTESLDLDLGQPRLSPTVIRHKKWVLSISWTLGPQLA
jgi:hypothetical protein